MNLPQSKNAEICMFFYNTVITVPGITQYSVHQGYRLKDEETLSDIPEDAKKSIQESGASVVFRIASSTTPEQNLSSPNSVGAIVEYQVYVKDRAEDPRYPSSYGPATEVWDLDQAIFEKFIESNRLLGSTSSRYLAYFPDLGTHSVSRDIILKYIKGV